MKKILLLSISVTLGLLSSAQVKNGTVFIQHPAIEKTKLFWQALEKGDKATLGTFLADTMVAIFNGNPERLKKENFLQASGFWSANFENFKVVDDTPAYPDAIDYSKGGLWVQDWLLVTGRHKKSGIDLELHQHNLYSFNKDGKIAALYMYYDQTKLEEIYSSGRTEENGKLYINHPYIITVRKLVNAYCAKDIVSISEFFAPNAVFANSTMKWGESVDLPARKAKLEADFAKNDNIVKMMQVGYPDCMYVAKSDTYVVYSWWVLSRTTKAGVKISEYPVMLSHQFNKDGKIMYEYLYYSSNHLQ